MKVLWRIAYRFNMIMALRMALWSLDVHADGNVALARFLAAGAALHRTRAEKFCALIKGRA